MFILLIFVYGLDVCLNEFYGEMNDCWIIDD